MFRIVEESKVLDVNSSYSDLMWGKYFSKSSIVAELDHELIGFVTGFLQPNSPTTLFVWQVAVDPKHRGKTLATRLIETLLDEQKSNDVCYLEERVTPNDIPSSKLFKGIAKKLKTECNISECFSEEQFPASSREPEMTYRIGPF